MKTKKSPCSSCIVKGYSRELCTLHRKKIVKDQSLGNDQSCGSVTECAWKSFGKKAAVGAGIGIAGIFAGLAVLPALGLKAILGHSLATNLSGIGGTLGAGANMAIHHRQHCQISEKKKKKTLLLSKYGMKVIVHKGN